MIRFILFIGLFFSLTTCFSQENKREIDSLKTLINNTSVDTMKVKYLMKLEYAYRFYDHKKGLEYADKALKISYKINFKRGIALCYNNIGNSYLDRGEHSKALEKYAQSLDYSEKFPKIRLTTLMNISNIYLREKNFKLSLKYINDTYDIALKLNDKIGVAYCYYQLGLISRDQKKIEIAKDYFEKSLAIFMAENNQFQIAELTNFIGEVTTDYKQKLNLFLKSKSVWDEIDPSYVSAINNSNQIVKIYIEVIKNDNLKKESGIIKTNTQLLSEAEKLVNESIEYSKRSDVKQYLMDAYLLLSEIKYLKREFSEAYNYSIMHAEIKDSIFSQENKNKIAAIESQKEIELRDKEIQLNKLTLETKEKQKWLYIGGIFLLVIIGLLLFYQSRNRQKTNQKLQLLNSELDQANKVKTRFFSILNHDLRSPVANLIHFLHLQKDNPELMDEATKNRMQSKTISGAENLLSSMEDILLWSKGQMENFKPEPKKITVHQLFEDNKKVFSGYHNITFEYQNPDDVELFTDENYLKTIIRNLTSNAINVFTTTHNPTIIWKAWQNNGKSYLSISDNGPGASQEQFKALYDDKEVVGIKSGLGLHLIRDLAKAINCEIAFDSILGEGTTFTLTFI